MCVEIINSIGLMLDMFGVILLFHYGLPSKIKEGDALLLEGDDIEQKKLNKKFERRAYLGLILLFLGFLLQLISNWI